MNKSWECSKPSWIKTNYEHWLETWLILTILYETQFKITENKLNIPMILEYLAWN